MRVCSRLIMLLLVTAAVFVSVGGPAGADVVSPPGACSGVGFWRKAKLTERSADHVSSDVIKIPRRDVVAWQGAIKGGKLNAKTTRRDIAGSVDIDLPLGQSITIDDWDKTSVRVANKGRHGYNLPVFFEGVKFKLHGHHD